VKKRNFAGLGWRKEKYLFRGKGRITEGKEKARRNMIPPERNIRDRERRGLLKPARNNPDGG